MFGEIFYQKCINCGAVCEDSKLPVCPDCLSKIQNYPFRCKTCGAPLMREAAVCGTCLKMRNFDKIFVNYPYQGAIKSLLREIKFGYRVSGISSITTLVTFIPERQYDF